MTDAQNFIKESMQDIFLITLFQSKVLFQMAVESKFRNAERLANFFDGRFRVGGEYRFSICICRFTSAFGRPPNLPRALAEANPAFVRSVINSLSNSASAPKT